MKWYIKSIILGIYSVLMTYLDSITTYFGLTIGLAEANPIARTMMEIFGVGNYLFIIYPLIVSLTIFILSYLGHVFVIILSKYGLATDRIEWLIYFSLAITVTILEFRQMILNLYHIIAYLLNA